MGLTGSERVHTISTLSFSFPYLSCWGKKKECRTWDGAHLDETVDVCEDSFFSLKRCRVSHAVCRVAAPTDLSPATCPECSAIAADAAGKEGNREKNKVLSLVLHFYWKKLCSVRGRSFNVPALVSFVCLSACCAATLSQMCAFACSFACLFALFGQIWKCCKVNFSSTQ